MTHSLVALGLACLLALCGVRATKIWCGAKR